MNTISMEEILQLYKKINADPQKTTVIRTTLNKGTLNNKLNTNRPRGILGSYPQKTVMQLLALADVGAFSEAENAQKSLKKAL